MSALAHQLRLLRDSLRDIQEVPAPAIALLNDLLVRQEGLPAPADDTVAAERAYWQDYVAAVATEAAPTAVEAADGLDTAALQAWLRLLPGEAALQVLEARTVSRGFSKKTVLVRLAQNAALPNEIALRIDQPFNYLGTTVVDEYPWLTQLWKHGARIAQPFALQVSGNVLGQPFLVSAKVGGGAVGGNYVPPPRNAALVADVAVALAGIHAVPLGDLGGEPGAHIAREIDAYEADWRALGESSPAVEAGFAWVRRHISAAHGAETIVHNDYNFNNMMVEGDRL